MNIDKAVNLIHEYYQKSDFEKAEALCKKILQKKPKNIQTLHFLGIIHYRRGKYDSAIHCLNKALQINSEDAEIHYNLGRAFQKMQKFEEAVKCYEKALQLKPDFADSYINLGKICHEGGRLDDAVTNYQKALEINPTLAGVYFNIGVAFYDKGQPDEALIYYQKALKYNPVYADACNNAGKILKEKRQFDDAIPLLRKAIQFNPNLFDAYNNLGCVFQKKRLFNEAMACYQSALRINPDFTEAYFNMGNLYEEKSQINEAVDFYKKALQINPNYAEAYVNLAGVFKEKGLLDEAETYYGRALEIKPALHIAYSNMLLTMNYDQEHNPQAVFFKHLAFSKQYAEPLLSSPPSYANDRKLDRRLKIGYISPDFRRQSVGFFILPVLALHNRPEFEIYCYANLPVHDDMTAQMQAHADCWRNIVDMSDEKVVQLVREDKIDILVDLAGHTGHNRILVFARKPAPVQITWIGYPNTTGLFTVDYRIVDSFTDPPGMTEMFNTEKLLRMPDSFLCYRPDPDSPKVGRVPLLTEGRITFGSFNIFTKVTPEVIHIWSEILKELPDSRLVMKSRVFADKGMCDYATDLFVKQGVLEERIELLSFAPSFRKHLELYNRVDIALDTFPYNGTTTTFEALWMGVPVIVLEGNTHVSRVGVSVLSNLGLTECIAGTPDEYISVAVNLARDIEKLKFLRENLRDLLIKSPLTDVKLFVEHLEKYYRKIWEDWCKSI